MLQSKALDWLVLAFLVVCWGSAFAALKISTVHVPPLWNTAGRLAVALPVLAVVLVLCRTRLPPLRHPAWIAYAAIGLVGMAAPFFLYAYSAQRLPSAINAICNGASPIFTGLLAHAFIASERLTARKAAGVLLGFGGLVVLVAPRLQHGMTVEVAALGAALLGALFYAIANVLTKQAPAAPSSVGALMMCLWAALYAGGAAWAVEPLPPWPPLPALLSMVALGVFSTALATVGFVFLIQRRGPLFMSMAIYLAPVWATVLGMVALGERPGWLAFAALGLILAGVALVTLTRRRSV
ncbi:DMT family transporter [Phenylobacterium sp.]|uniref:DMT family transporter n=1 Tax=Phenylobacterium sp. TaxID=1871053 RepID=UPI003983CDBA